MVKRILSLIGWLGTALVVIAVVLKLPVFDKEAYARPFAIAGLVCVIAYALGEWREIAKVFERRQARYGSVAATSVAVVLGILVAINIIGKQQHKRWDLTGSKQFSLSDQTRNVLSKLDAPMEAIVFYNPEEGMTGWQDRMREYQYASKQLSTEFYDPIKKPALAKQYQIQNFNTVILKYKGRTERVTSNSEQDLTNGIIKVVTGQAKKVYFTQGHGEKDFGASDREGYNGVGGALGRENYTVDKVVLAQTGAVADDATVVVVAGPKIDFFPQEIDALKKYLDKAGKLLLEIDTPDKPDSPPLTNLIALAHDWGIEVGNDIVADASGMSSDPFIVVVAGYPSHPITQRFNNLITAYPLVRSVSGVSGGVNGHIAQTVIETSPKSWAETDVKSVLTSKPIKYDEGTDKKGPISLAAAVTAPAVSNEPPKPGDAPDAPKPETRVVVIGDADFATNVGLALTQGNNRDLFMNVMAWLAQQENLISIRPREPDDRRIVLTTAQQTNILLLALLVIPACIFGTGVYTWWRRR